MEGGNDMMKVEKRSIQVSKQKGKRSRSRSELTGIVVTRRKERGEELAQPSGFGSEIKAWKWKRHDA
ncbi:unnamed protein product [Prunus armeniaca]|uniref:Uncharacterized protein n=1 Tax=Prunus armeniaca TaxID=36596 RepID=A0A6J5VYP8_PRUAR|nr:unnamed protein product [Prunus armeniaca]